MWNDFGLDFFQIVVESVLASHVGFQISIVFPLFKVCVKIVILAKILQKNSQSDFCCSSWHQSSLSLFFGKLTILAQTLKKHCNLIFLVLGYPV